MRKLALPFDKNDREGEERSEMKRAEARFNRLLHLADTFEYTGENVPCHSLLMLSDRNT